MHHNEPVLRNGQVVGYVTSGAFSAHFQCAVGLCLLDLPAGAQGKAAIASGEYTVMIEGEPIAAEVSVQSFYDPLNERMLS
jgi:4-methylaminobutanoate oxidase (formaldehyde-forming)